MSDSSDAPPLGTPHGKGFYAVIAVVALLLACGFGYATVAAPSPVLKFFEAVIGLVFLAATVEAMDRLARPAATHARSIGLGPAVRARLRLMRNILVRTGWVLFFVGIVMHVSSNETVAGIGTDLEISAGVLWFAAWCVADYSGDKLAAFSRRLV